MQIKLNSCYAIYSWHWDIPEDEVCGICRVSFDGTCTTCKYPGDDCPLGKYKKSRISLTSSHWRMSTRFSHALHLEVARDRDRQRLVSNVPAAVHHGQGQGRQQGRQFAGSQPVGHSNKRRVSRRHAGNTDHGRNSLVHGCGVDFSKSLFSTMTDHKKFTIVVKVGSSSIVDEVTHEPRIANVSTIVETLVALRRQGHRIVLVSSGAIAIGLHRMGLDRKPKRLSAVQALAALGQGKLQALWDSMFSYRNQKTAQILLTRNDITDFSQFRNAENTLIELLDMGVVPIVNENDTVSTQEIKFGDNDTLSAITAGMCNADFLFLLTDVDCLYTENPRLNPNAKPVVLVKNMNSLEVNTKSSGSSIGTGGMETKLIAADLATNAGVTTVICNSQRPHDMIRIANYICETDAQLRESREVISAESHEQFQITNATEFSQLQHHKIPLHTRFIGQPRNAVKNKEFWLLHGLKPAGALIIDPGCYEAITRRNRAGLLPVGVIGVEGEFGQLECVDIRVGIRDSATGRWDRSKGAVSVGRGRCNYSSYEIDKIKGLHTHEIPSAIEYFDSEYVVHRHNLAFPLHKNSELEQLIQQSSI
ncbi:hypothetical protein KL949_002545 [Ogataea haglerorum]|nr:hypothetical protein KL913_005333 [Ogataea haglerorum]KAG7719553.1 hypothetical protein KL949_002545 [Ogataea haglerorum]KAG7767538.1 hypothetical protein KL931_003351 [Ogataea haglerorum]